jgi:hypothetical protein
MENRRSRPSEKTMIARAGEAPRLSEDLAPDVA